MNRFGILFFNIFLALAVVFSPLKTSAHERIGTVNDSPWLIDEFGPFNSEDLQARLDNWAARIHKNSTFKTIVVIFPPKDKPFGFPYRYAAIIKTYLTKNKGVEPKRVVIVYGDVESNVRTQVYLVPQDSNLSTSIGIERKPNSSKTFLFDSFGLSSPNDFGTCCAVDEFDREETLASFEVFAKQLNENKNLKGYIIAYAQYCPDCGYTVDYDRKGNQTSSRPIILRDSFSTAAALARSQKEQLINNFALKPSRIIAVNGGFHRSREIELYLVPENGIVPKPTPTMFPGQPKRQAKKKARSR